MDAPNTRDEHETLATAYLEGIRDLLKHGQSVPSVTDPASPASNFGLGDKEILIPKYVEVEQPELPKPLLFAKLADDELLGYGVPPEWLADARGANEDTLLILADHLPAEAAEALLELAVGGKPEVAAPVAVGADPFAHPDAQRRFRVMSNVEELVREIYLQGSLQLSSRSHRT